MDVFTGYMQPILVEEGRGKLTNNRDDRGGVTIWGITETRARAAGYTGAMADMTQDQAMSIYRLYFWEQPGFDKLAAILESVAVYMLDIGINSGPHTPSLMLQRLLNVLSLRGTLYPRITADGSCGAMTRAALLAYRAVRSQGGDDGDGVLLAALRGLVVARDVEIAEGDPTQETNIYGWLRRAGRQL